MTDVTDDDLIISVERYPSIMWIALSIAPLVRLGIVTAREGRMLVALRYCQERARLRST